MRTRILAALGFLLLPPGAANAAMVTVEKCEPVQVGGVTLNRLTLALTSDQYATAVLLDGRISAVHADTCRVLTATAPARRLA